MKSKVFYRCMNFSMGQVITIITILTSQQSSHKIVVDWFIISYQYIKIIVTFIILNDLTLSKVNVRYDFHFCKNNNFITQSGKLFLVITLNKCASWKMTKWSIVFYNLMNLKNEFYFKRFISPDISICMYAYRMVREALVKVSASRKVRWLEPRNSCVRLVILTEDLTVWGTYLKLFDDSSLQESVR